MGPSNKRTANTTVIVLIVTTLLIGGAVVFSRQNVQRDNLDKPGVTNNANSDNFAPQNETAGNAGASYKRGSYSAIGDYQSPGGGQKIKIHVTLGSDGTITESSAQGDDKSSDSKFYQSSFIANYKSKVVGRNINEVKLDQVGASSLTPQGFNKALEDIKNQAKA